MLQDVEDGGADEYTNIMALSQSDDQHHCLKQRQQRDCEVPSASSDNFVYGRERILSPKQGSSLIRSSLAMLLIQRPPFRDTAWEFAPYTEHQLSS